LAGIVFSEIFCEIVGEQLRAIALVNIATVNFAESIVESRVERAGGDECAELWDWLLQMKVLRDGGGSAQVLGL
jgi:hypothetical protein